MKNLKENKPTADILMTSMRAMGYSFESAIADIVDNSISAHAKNIQILFPKSPSEIYIAIIDDGDGMNQEELFDAMKYGSEQKRGTRSDDDLGRFGLGLKAASLSQCRKLTVVSKKDNKISAYIWDLDIIEEKKDWFIVECASSDIPSIKFVNELDTYETGTIVLWEDFDLMEKATGSVYSELIQHQEEVADYLSLIFHRFLNGPSKGAVKIRINNYDLEGMDPFLENHIKTNARKPFVLPIEDSEGIERSVLIRPFVLPFIKDLSDTDKKKSGGIENYRSKQGFYIYRNERLIVWGSWFGRPRDELTKYARISVDIPNTLDDIWGIDIKKQNAKIPAKIKRRLTRAVDDAMDTAIKAQTHRGRVEKIDERVDYIWDRIKERDNHYSYRINRNAKIFEIIREKVEDDAWDYFDMLIDEIERSVPYQQIYIDKSQNIIDDNVDEERNAEIEAKARMFLKLACDIGNKDCCEIIENLFSSEPFNNYPSLKKKLLEEQNGR